MHIESQSFHELSTSGLCLDDFFHANNLDAPPPESTPQHYFASLPQETLSDLGLNVEDLLQEFSTYVDYLKRLLADESRVQTLEIIRGIDKSGNEEKTGVVLQPGDVLSIVGPTGAGKSRLLEDIECLAQEDTPTRRQVLINGEAPSDEERFNLDNRLVAQLSQNMNFVVDLNVEEFVTMHAESRMIEDTAQVIDEIFTNANRLAGEPFARSSSVTSLSGGQSRALMIADTACLSRSPIVLIDEIENAGIDRNLAMDLLVKKEKIVILVTHDPGLALFAPRRLVIQGGGMQSLIERTAQERETLETLRSIAFRMETVRHAMRSGNELRW